MTEFFTVGRYDSRIVVSAEALKRQREIEGLSYEDVALSMRRDVRWVECMESEDSYFDDLPRKTQIEYLKALGWNIEQVATLS